MQSLDSLVTNLAKTQKSFLRAADAVPSELWKASPSVGRWSAAEVVAHLMMVERAVIGKADRVVQNPPKHVPFMKRFHLPTALVESRLVRRKTLIPVDTAMLRDKEGMLAELREVRERSFSFLEETKSRDLSEYRWAHPALGTLNTYQWIQFISSHEIRHAKQMEEIAASLPKLIDNLQK
jgi:DinB family protein